MEDRTETNIRAALPYISAEDRVLWIKIGMALKTYFGEPGFDLWNEWSKTGSSYNFRSAQAAWRSFKVNGRLSIGTIFYEAKCNGFRRN
jgi:putative DNA primase/helicase